MIIAIDGNEANVKNRVGVNQFAFEILWAIYQNYCRCPISNFKKFLIFFKEKPFSDLPPETKWWRYEVFGPKQFWTWTGLVKRLFLRKPKPDILFTPSHYGPAFSPIPFVISIMDLGFLRWPQQFTKKDFYQLKFWTKWSVKKATKIIAISKFTKKDLIKTYKINPQKVVVAYPGWKKIKSQKFKDKNYQSKLKFIKNKYQIKGDYILCLGTLKPSKNIEGLIDAYSILVSRNKILDSKLVIAGKKGWLYKDIFRKVKKSNLERNVIFTGFVPDEEVPILLKGAKVFVLPSFWEGAGIPALEAMAAGVPVVCSNQGALPEIANNAAVMINPYSPKNIAQGIKKALNNKDLRRKLIKMGKKRAKMFSWNKCSKIILETLINEIDRLQYENR